MKKGEAGVIIMSRQLALRLGALEPENPAHQRELRESFPGPYFLIREPWLGLPLLWPMAPGVTV